MSTCAFCHSSCGQLVCGRCGQSHYCNIECQRKDWKTHKNECKPSKKDITATKDEALDFDKHQNKTSVNEEFMTFVWELEEKEFDNFQKSGECRSDDIEIEVEKYSDFKWEWILKSNENRVE
eukprot:491806_1